MEITIILLCHTPSPHYSAPLSPTLTQLPPSLHTNMKITMYCCDCKATTCSKCSSSSHNLHHTEIIADVIDNERANLQKVLKGNSYYSSATVGLLILAGVSQTLPKSQSLNHNGFTFAASQHLNNTSASQHP